MANDTTLDKVVIEFDGKVNNFDASIDTLIEEIKGLRQELKDMSKDTENAGDDIDEATESIDDMDKSAKSLSKSLSSVKKTFAVFAGMTRSIMKFTEMSTNAVGVQTRFNSVFGSTKEELKEAKTWVDEYSNSLYLDSAEVMNAASNFKLLAGNIGLTNKEANIMSEGLTKLSYDLMALRGENDASMAQTALMSAMGGEAEAMKRYGVMLNQATLQQTLYSLGIDRTVSSLNAAERAQLIYYQIMNTTAGQQGYYAKTLMSPANALNIIKTQFRLLGREVGNVFIPILMELLPVIIAITEVLKELAQWLANIFNIDIDFEDITSGMDDITGGIGDIGDEADKTSAKIKNMTRDFDKLHVVNFDTGSGSGSGQTGGIGGSGFGDAIDLTPYKEWNAELDKSKEKVEKIKNWLYEAKDYIIAIVAALATGKVASGILTFLDKAELFSTKGNIIQAAIGIGLTMGSMYLLYQGIQHLVDGEWTAENIMKTALGIAGLTAGVMTTVKGFTGTSLGLANGIAVSFGITATIVGFEFLMEGLKENNILDSLIGTLMGAVGAGLTITKLTGGKVKFGIGAAIALGIGSFATYLNGVYENDMLQAIIGAIGTAVSIGILAFKLGAGGLVSITLTASLTVLLTAFHIANSEDARKKIANFFDKLTQNIAKTRLAKNNGSIPLAIQDWLDEKAFEDALENAPKATKEQLQMLENTPKAQMEQQKQYIEENMDEIQKIIENGASKSLQTTERYGYRTAQYQQSSNNAILSSTKTMTQGVTSEYKAMEKSSTTMVQGITSEYKSMEKATNQSTKSLVENIKNGFSNMFTVGSEKITSLKTSVTQNAKLLEQGGVASVKTFVNNSLNNMKKMQITGSGDMTTLTADTIATLKELQRSGNPEVAKFATASLNQIKNMTSMVKTDITDMQKTTVSKFTDLGNKISNAFTNARTSASSEIEKIKDLTKFEWKLPTLKTPKFTWSTVATNVGSTIAQMLNAFNLPSVVPQLKIDWFAGGGFPDTGSLFVANEREPELIGSWGNKSMVANSTQIIKGIESASYNGMKRALTEVPMSNETNVYVGNKQLTDVVTKQQRINNNKYGR